MFRSLREETDGVKWTLFHQGVANPRVTDEGGRPQVWRVTEKLLSNSGVDPTHGDVPASEWQGLTTCRKQ
jgi:hypothetical protein